MDTFLVNKQLEENAREQRNNDAYWNNLQIEKLNEEIQLLKEQNSELKKMNNSNKHYWRNTFIIGTIVAIISYLLGLLT